MNPLENCFLEFYFKVIISKKYLQIDFEKNTENGLVYT